MLQSYRTAQKRIERQLRDAAITPAARFRLGGQLDEVRTVIRALNAQARDAARATIEQSYDYGARLSDYAMHQQGAGIGKPFRIDTPIHRDAVQRMAESMVKELTAANASLQEHAERAIRKTRQVVIENARIEEEIAQGLITGDERRRVSMRIERTLKEALEEGTRVTVQTPKGTRSFEPDYYAELVTRTMTRDAVTLANLQRGRELGQKLFRVSVHDGACEVCQLFQGKVFADGGEHDGFPALEEHPPYHPNCGHVVSIFIPTGRSEEELDALRRISNDEGRIHDFDDYQRVRAGGKLQKEPREWDDETKAMKAERRKRFREGIVKEDLRPTSEEKKISMHEADQVIRDLTAGAELTQGDLSRIQAKATTSGFITERSLTDHLSKRVSEERQLAPGTTAEDYQRAIKRAVTSSEASVAVYQRRGGNLAAFIVPTDHVIPVEKQGPKADPHFAVIYSSERGSILSAYMISSKEELSTGEHTRWLR